MLRRMAGRKDCGNCYRPFKPFETVHYLGIDHCSYCADCREKLRPGEKDDPNDHGGWVPALYVGFGEEGRETYFSSLNSGTKRIRKISTWNIRFTYRNRSKFM